MITSLLTILVSALAAASFPQTDFISEDTAASASVCIAEKVKTVTVTFSVNMHCKKCVAKLTDRLSFEKGVEDLRISLEAKTVQVTYNPRKTSEGTLAKAIEKCGYTATVIKE